MLQIIFFANFAFITSPVHPSEWCLASTSLQPISRCKAIKTSEERRRNPFCYSLFCVRIKSRNVLQLYCISFHFWFAVFTFRETLKCFISNIIEFQGWKSVVIRPRLAGNQSILKTWEINIRLNELIAECSFSINQISKTFVITFRICCFLDWARKSFHRVF